MFSHNTYHDETTYTTVSVYSHTTYHTETTYTTEEVFSHYGDRYDITPAHWTEAYCHPTEYRRDRPRARAIVGSLWMILDGILWGLFYHMKPKALAYFEPLGEAVFELSDETYEFPIDAMFDF